MTQSLRQPGIDAKDGAGDEMQSTLLRVSGIFRTGLEAVDANIINLPLPAAQALLGVQDGQVTQVAIAASTGRRLADGGKELCASS